MSLFNLKEVWSTSCGENEEFDRNSLCVCNVDNSSNEGDKMIVASLNGTLRVLKVDSVNQLGGANNTKFSATDLLLEIDLKEPILQIGSGLLLASNNVQLAVLHPRRFCVYSISSSSGIIEHGTSYNILLIYEHRFETSKAYNMCLGSFGQSNSGKDTVCIQDVNATLNFYENENFSFAYAQADHTNRVFPMEFVYLPSKDLLVMATKLMSIECYRYQEIALAGLHSAKRDDHDAASMSMEWSYSFAETILEMSTVVLDKWYIVVLGERNLLVLKENGTAWFVKKFDVSPSCSHAFANETRDALITIVATHTPNLLIYQNDVLKWATNIVFVPVAISRINLAEMTGALVLLSDEGHISVGYLGTNPSLKMITMPSTPAVASNFDGASFEKANQELQQLRKLITNHNVEGNRAQAEENKFAAYFDVRISITNNEWSPVDGGGQVMDALVELIGLSTFTNVQLVFFSDVFLTNPEREMVAILNEPHPFEMAIQLRRPYQLPLSAKIEAMIIFSADNVSRVVQKSLTIPFGDLVKLGSSNSNVSTGSKSYRYSTQLALARPSEEKMSLTGLFDDFLSNPASISFISFTFRCDSHAKSIIKLLPSSSTFQIEANNLAALLLTTKELARRLNGKETKPMTMVVNFALINLIASKINARIKQRNTLRNHKNQLARFSEHYRVVLKRILVRLKDKNPTSLANLERVLFMLQQKINECVENITVATQVLTNKNYQVWLHLKYLKQCLKQTIKHGSNNASKMHKLSQFLKVITIHQMDDFTQDWEERMVHSMLEVLDMGRDIDALAKVIHFQNNPMDDSDEARRLLLLACQMFNERSAGVCALQIAE